MSERTPGPAITIRQVAWLAGTALFLATRTSAALRAPVSGPELDGLSGAWRAAAGATDPRFLATLGQVLTRFTLEASAGETGARLLALAASATIPLALFIGRRALGEPGALVTLALLALDPVSIALGSTANAASFDQAIAVWLLVALLSPAVRPLAWAGIGAAVATGGPLPLLLAGAGLGRWAFAAERWRPSTAVPIVLGAAVGLAFVSAGAGFGVPAIRVPPFDVLAAGLEGRWSSATVAELTLAYEAPLLLAGSTVAAHRLAGWAVGVAPAAADRLLLAWTAAGFGYWAIGFGAHDPGAVLALSFPLCFLSGLGLAGSSLGRPRSQGPVPALGLAAAGTAVLGLLVLFSGAVAVARGADGEPLLSPAVPASAGAVRDLLLAEAQGRQGGIVIHPDLADAATWALRDSGATVLGSRVPRSDAVVVWPAGRNGPQGYRRASGRWPLTVTADTPGSDLGSLVRWFTQRGQPGSGEVEVDVYTGGTP